MLEKYLTDTHKSILCLNGDIPELPFLKTTKLPIIATDGASDTLINYGIKPQLIIEDLDSIDLSLIQNQSIKLKHEPCQNNSDFQKALKYLEKMNLLPTIILGLNSGVIDHILNNINIFIESDNIFYAPPILGYTLKKTASTFSFPQNTKVSLIGIPSALVSTTGLRWELNQNLLIFPGNTSCFNRTDSHIFSIHVHQGTLLALFYLEEVNDSDSQNLQNSLNALAKAV